MTTRLRRRQQRVNWPAITSLITAITAVGALIFTGLSLNATRDQVAVAQGGQRIAQQGQFTDRYSRAIDQLGRKGPDLLQIRLGGIYALERLAIDSRSFQPTVVEVLSTFVRTSVPRSENCPTSSWELEHPEELAEPTQPDVQAALTVLGRRKPANDKGVRIDLTGVCLHGADLSNVNLPGVDLSGTSLFNANLMGAKLEGANLTNTDTEGADFTGAVLTGVDLKYTAPFGNFRDADLRDADLAHAYCSDVAFPSADLRGVNLSGTNLAGADFEGANLSGVNLHGKDLSRVNLIGANLFGADLSSVNLTEGSLANANLKSANLTDANLADVDLSGAKHDESTIVNRAQTTVNTKGQWWRLS